MSKKFSKKKFFKDRKSIKLTHEFYNELLDNVQESSATMAQKLKDSGATDKEIYNYLRNVNNLSYHEAMRIIKKINDN